MAIAALERLGMAHLSDRPYTEISGGERQMVLIARALAQQPKVLVMDEPTASLDYGNQIRVLSHVRRLAKEGMAIVLSTDNPDHVFMVADRVTLLHDGALVAIGYPADVLTPQRIRQLYDIDVVMGTLPGSGFQVCSPHFHALDLAHGNTTSEPRHDGPLCRIEIYEPWVPALKGVENFERLEILYWLHQSRRDLVLQSPASNGKIHGTFSLRSPVRPNPIGTSIVTLEDMEDNVLLVRGLDCLEGTPLLDLKPDRTLFKPIAPPQPGDFQVDESVSTSSHCQKA